MNRFIAEALFVGFKVGLLVFLSIFLAAALFGQRGQGHLRKPLFAGLFLVFLASLAVLTAPVTPVYRTVAVKLTGYSFGLFYLSSLGALFHATGTDLFGPFKKLTENRILSSTIVLLLTLIYAAPDMLGSVLYLLDMHSMAEQSVLVYAAAGAGIAVAGAVMKLSGGKIRPAIDKLFDLPQALLFLALLKLVGGGVRGFAEFSLIPAVQSGLMKLVHDIVHQLLVMLMVPDHPILTVTAWNFMAVFFGEAAGLWLSLVILFVPPALFLKKYYSLEIVPPAGMQPGPVRRSYVKSVRRVRLLKSIPLVLFMAFIGLAWFSEQGESAAPLYNPSPRPLISDNERVVIPLESAEQNLRDGQIHKYLIQNGAEEIRILIMKKPDGTLAACLDACDICPPDGYAQGRGHLLCLYCNTPIPFATVGTPGGCNPIPIAALVTDRDVRIEMKELIAKWTAMKVGGARENLRK